MSAPASLRSLPLQNRELARLAAPFVERGVLSLADVHVVDRLGVLGGEHDASVLLGLAFAVRAPRVGHIGVDLATIARSAAIELADDTAEPRVDLPWPSDAAEWNARVRASVLVGDPDACAATDASGGSGAIERRPFVRGRRLVTTLRYHRYELRLRDAIVRRAEAPEPGIDGAPIDVERLRGDLDRLFADAAPLQRLGGLLTLLRPLSVLSGGPGTGKTFTVRKLLLLLHAQWQARWSRPPRVALAAPTGKAAVRLKQALGEQLDALPIGDDERAWLRGREATTIHRLLGWDPANPTRFRHGLERRIAYDVVVVDEASMVDLALMSKLVDAVADGARLVLLGDRDQLASVEAGSVLADLTARAGLARLRFTPAFVDRLTQLEPSLASLVAADASVPPLADGIVHFHQPFRFDAKSGIGRVARAIADGSPDRLGDAAAWLSGRAAAGEGPFDDLELLPHRDGALSKEALAAIVAGYRGYLELLRRGPRADQREEPFHAEVLRAFERVRVLAAVRRGPFGVGALNATIQAALHEALPDLAVSTPFWAGRPLLITENAYDVGRMNGDVGLVVGRQPGRDARVAFAGLEPGTVEYLDVARLPPHETVFAMTIHKSQGSQFAHPFVVLPDRASPVVTRELVYTAITRARDRVTVAAAPAMLLAALDRRVPRASELGELLWPNPPTA
jgi:exodeoxyribonuclease V alpha subunit